MKELQFYRLINIFLLFLLISSLLAYQIHPQPTNSDNIRVVTYNIHQYYEQEGQGRISLLNIKDELLQIDADIIGLQESEGVRISSSNINGIQWLASELNMYAYYGPDTSAQIYGVSLLSKYPIIESSYELLHAEESIERVAITVFIELPFGVLPVIVTHFQTGSYIRDRTAQAQRIVQMASSYDQSIVFGDFNTKPDLEDPAFKVLNSSLTDVWLNCASKGTGFTSDAANPYQRIDYIWLYGSFWKIIANSCYVFGDPQDSDHLGFSAQLKPN